MDRFNTIVLHQVKEDQAINFTDITLPKFRHILETAISIGSVTTLDIALKCPKQNTQNICLTFDDGFASDYSLVFPLLQKMDAKATFFIVTDWLDKPGYLTSDQVLILSAAGMQIGSHSKSHPNFLSIDHETRVEELRSSKLVLEKLIEDKVTSFSFPYGFYDNECVDAVLRAGYTVCCTSRHGLATVADQTIPRNSINANTTDDRIEKILLAFWRQRLLWGMEDHVKSLLKKYASRQYAVIRKFLSKL